MTLSDIRKLLLLCMMLLPSFPSLLAESLTLQPSLVVAGKREQYTQLLKLQQLPKALVVKQQRHRQLNVNLHRQLNCCIFSKQGKSIQDYKASSSAIVKVKTRKLLQLEMEIANDYNMGVHFLFYH